MINIGNINIKKMFLGTDDIKSIFVETEKVWPTDSYSGEYLTFEALESGTFSFTKIGTGNDIQYSLDNGSTWTSLASNANTPTVSAGSKILWKGTLSPGSSGSNYGIGKFSSSGEFKVEGNAMSLLYGDDFEDKKNLTNKGFAFRSLFEDCANLVSAENLSLPATTLSTECYGYMFCGCTSLTDAPELPATTLTSYCYQYMFEYCTSLTTAPELPATTLTSYCYANMFYGCSGLTTAPQLPATTLANYCYFWMFYGCTSLTAAPELPATTLADFCYASMFNSCTRLNYIKCLATNISAGDCTYNWVYGVALSGTFVKAEGMNKWTTGRNGIPSGWTVQNA